MNRKTILAVGAVAGTVVIGAVTLPALAHGWGPGSWGHDGRGAGCTMMDGGWGPGRMGHGGPRLLGALTENPVYKSFDGNADGIVSTEELETGITALHAKYDADKSGNLSAAEFDSLFAEVSKSFAQRPFAMLDADGDKEISADEMAFPAKMMARMQAWHGMGAPSAQK